MSNHPLVVHVLWTLGRAGAERMVLDISSRLPEHGYRVMVLAPGGGGPLEAEFRDRGIVYQLGPVTDNRRETYAFLRQAIRAERPRLWHTHLGGDIWGGLLAWRERIHPWVITAHNTDQDDRWSLHQARKLAFRQADHVACVSGAVRSYVKEEFEVKDERLSVIKNGIDPIVCSPRGEHPFRDIPHIVTIGRLNKQKDQATLLHALAGVKRPWRLSIFGDGPEELTLRQLAASLGILPRVQFLGSVPQVVKRLPEADVFCFPSQWEGQGLALLEAMASGVPVIASDLSVFRESFDDRAIHYAKPGDQEAWSRALLHVLARPAEAMERARKARAIVCEQFTLDRMVQEYVALYEQQLSQHASNL